MVQKNVDMDEDWGSDMNDWSHLPQDFYSKAIGRTAMAGAITFILMLTFSHCSKDDTKNLETPAQKEPVAKHPNPEASSYNADKIPECLPTLES